MTYVEPSVFRYAGRSRGDVGNDVQRREEQQAKGRDTREIREGDLCRGQAIEDQRGAEDEQDGLTQRLRGDRPESVNNRAYRRHEKDGKDDADEYIQEIHSALMSSRRSGSSSSDRMTRASL